MKKQVIKTIKGLAFLMIAGLLFSACKKDDEKSQVDKMIDEVRTATKAYSSLDAAKAAGWAVDLSGCVAHPEEGGMGHHYARLEWFDGRVNHLEPQVLLYEPQADSSFVFVGVEYIVPFEILSAESPAPKLFDHHFHANHALGIWALHVWTERNNPKGMFYDWNPNVSCP